MAIVEPKIKRINLADGEHEIQAKYLDDGSGNAKSWEDITNLVQAGFEIEVVTTLPTITAANYNDYRNKLLLKQDASASAGTYLEYVAYKTSGETPTYGLEQIGSTQTDLTNYVQKGTYTTGAPSTNATGAVSGAGTVTSSTVAGYVATGTATVVYKKSATVTSSAGGATVQGSNFTFTGTTATLEIPYKPAGSIGGSYTLSTHNHTVTKSTATVLVGVKVSSSTTVVTGYPNFSGGSKAADTFTPNKPAVIDTSKFSGGSLSTKNYGFSASTSQVMSAPTVSGSGVLSWSESNAGTQDVLTPASLASGFYTAGTTASFSEGAFTSAALGAASTASVATGVGANGTTTVLTNVSLADSGSATIQGSNFSFTGTQATLTVDYVPTGSIGGSQTISAHTHGITLSDTTVVAAAGVNILGHAHTVGVAAHTHSLSNHTHAVDLNSNPS